MPEPTLVPTTPWRVSLPMWIGLMALAAGPLQRLRRHYVDPAGRTHHGAAIDALVARDLAARRDVDARRCRIVLTDRGRRLIAAVAGGPAMAADPSEAA